MNHSWSRGESLDAHASMPVSTSLIQQASHQDAIRFQQVFLHMGLPLFKEVICSDRVTHFLDFPWRGHDRPAFQLHR
jgi:hypothetical protein